MSLAQRVDEQANHFGLVFGTTNVAIHMASVECEMRRPEAALRVADDIDVSRAPSIERRVTHLGQIARACEDLGNDAATLVHLLRIERECPEELDHKRLLREMVRSLTQRARPSWAPEVRQLADRLRRLLGGEETAWLVERVRRRLELGKDLTGTVTLTGASLEQRRAIERLLGRRAGTGASLSVSLDEGSASRPRSASGSAAGGPGATTPPPMKRRSPRCP